MRSRESRKKRRGKEGQELWWTLPALPFGFTPKYGILSRHPLRIIEGRKSGKLILWRGEERSY